MIISGLRLYIVSLLLLTATIPFASGTPYMGLPLWVWFSLLATAAYAALIIYLIQKRWPEFQGSDDA